jgi:hypothetical protein
MSDKEFSWGQRQPARRADNCAVLVVQNVKVIVEAQYSYIPLSQENFTFVTHSERVCVASFIHHVKRMLCILWLSVTGLALPYFPYYKLKEYWEKN